MATYYGDSYGGVMSAELADKNARAAREQDALRLILGIAQQRRSNALAEREFQANQERVVTQLAQQKKEFDFKKDLAIKGMEADAATLEFNKAKQTAIERQAADALLFKREQLKSNEKIAGDQMRYEQTENLFSDAMEEAESGTLLDPYDAETAYPTLDPKRREAVIRRSKQVHEQQAYDYEAAKKIANTLNYQTELEAKVAEDKSAKSWNIFKSEATEIANRRKELEQLKLLTKKFGNKEYQSVIIFDSQSGKYVPLIKPPQTFRDKYPQRIQQDPGGGYTGSDIGRLRQMESEPAGGYTGSNLGNLRMSESEPMQEPYTPPVGSQPIPPDPFTPPVGSRPMQDQSGLHPLAKRVFQLVKEGLSEEDAVRVAEEELARQSVNMGNAWPY